MAKYVEKLNDLVPNLSLKYDEEKDQLNKSTDAIYRNIDALKEQAKVKAYTENYEAAVKEQAEVEKKLNDARVQYHKNLEELDRAQRKLNALFLSRMNSAGSALASSSVSTPRKAKKRLTTYPTASASRPLIWTIGGKKWRKKQTLRRSLTT